MSAPPFPPASASGPRPAAPFGQTAVRGKPPLSEHTQVIPRVPAATAAPTPPAAPTNSSSRATPYPAISDLHPGGTTTVAPDEHPTTTFVRPRFDPAPAPPAETGAVLTDTGYHAGTEPDTDITADARGDVVEPNASPRHHRLVWVGLVVFWALGLGAGLVTLTSLGARASCTGSDKSLDCGNAGSAIAVVLTLCVIVLVGVVTVHAVEVRDRAKSWGRDLGLGVLVLIMVSFAAWRLISTING